MTKTNTPSTRDLALQVLLDVLQQGRSLTDALAKQQKHCANQQRPLLQALCFGVMRHYPRLVLLKNHFLQKPLAKKDFLIEVLLLMGFYQLLEMRIADHAVVNETVNLAKKQGKSWASKLLNGILRRFLREKENALQAISHHEEAQTWHPLWLLTAIQKAYPNDWQDICQHNNLPGPMTLRVNQQKISRTDYQLLLEKKAISAEPCQFSSVGLRLTQAVPVDALPGFAQGLVSVQDEAGQLAAGLCQLNAHSRVLDACAAPGSKLCHLLEVEANLNLTGLDISTSRLALIEENLKRLELKAKLHPENATELNRWWDGQPFDCILLDAPCSATGVIRRHPDIKFLRRAEDIAALSQQQSELLSALWPTLRVGGRLVYATCSILPEENEAVIAGFLAQQSNAHSETLAVSWGRAGRYGRQLLPGANHGDGFYYAILSKS